MAKVNNITSAVGVATYKLNENNKITFDKDNKDINKRGLEIRLIYPPLVAGFLYLLKIK